LISVLQRQVRRALARPAPDDKLLFEQEVLQETGSVLDSGGTGVYTWRVDR
jgi:hypothetical protein